MSLCLNDGGQCMCQPDEGIACPVSPKGWRRWWPWQLYVTWKMGQYLRFNADDHEGGAT